MDDVRAAAERLKADWPNWSPEDVQSLINFSERARWHSAHETPDFCGVVATRVVVRLERINNPPAMNAPPHYAFGHRIVVEDNPNWPKGGWFFDGQDPEYHVTAWRYIDGEDAEYVR